jgi:hypothetical protein
VVSEQVTNLYSHWLLLVPRVRMQILMEPGQIAAGGTRCKESKGF